MKTVTEQQKQDFREQQKYFTLTFSGGTILTNDNIVLDSMRITRTLCDSEQISFNTVYASEFSIQIFNDGRKYEGQTVTVSLTAGTYTTNLGTYTVVSNPRSSDRLYRSLTAYDSIAAVLSKNYADWHNGLKNSPPATIGAYRTAFFNHIGITQESTTLCNDATAFNYAETNGALSGATILGELCSINGTFGYLDFDQTFRWVTPYIDASGTLVPSLTLYPSTTLYPASVDAAIENLGVDTYKVDTDSYDLGGLACEEFVTQNITQVYMHQGDVVYASGTQGNRLTITNTLFIMEPAVAVQAVANIKATVKDFNYTPTSVTMLATPWLELCDVVVADVSPTEKVYFPVLNFVINGTGAIRQTIEAKGVMVNSDEATNTDYKIITASNSADYAAELARQAQQAANTAQEAADTAQEAAETAQTTAEAAQDSADEVADDLAYYIASCEIIVGTQTAVTGSWTGDAEFSILEDGQQIAYWLPYAGSGNASLNLTLSDGTQTGAIPVYYKGSTRATTHFSAGTVIHLTYRVNADVAGTPYTGWWADASYDSGNTYNRIRFENAIKAKVAITKNHLIVGDSSGYFPLAANTPFDFTNPILWATADIAATKTATTNYLAINSITLRNNLANVTLTQYSTCYLVGTLNGNTFTPKAGQFFTSTVPTTDDGYYYVSLGYLYSTYQIYLYPEHPIYKFVDGSFKSLNQVAYDASVTASDAQDAADTAQQAADDAQTAADNAQQSADDAQTAADNAQQSADDAQATADAAETKAKQAMATYGNCSTAASTAEKAVTCDDFPFVAGATLKVYFASASDVATPTLNVNSTSAKAIYVKGQTVNATTNPLMWAARTYITFIYDGTKFNVLDTPGTYTITCQTADATHAKVTDTMYNAIIMTGTTVNVFFTTAYTTSGALTLKVDSTIARTVFFGDAAVSSTNPFTWNAGTNISFTLQGGYWYIADSGATDKATEAGRTATNYMYMSTAKGLVISRSPVTNDAGVEALSAPNSRVVSDGFDVYKNGTARVAHFGATTDIGETGNSHLTIDSTSLKFKNGNDTDNLVINNNISGSGKKTDTNVVLDEDRTYNNADGTLNQSTMAQLLYAIVEAHTMTSAYGDYVTSTTGVALNIVIKGYATLDPTTGSDAPMRSVRIDSYGGRGTISNGVLTYVPAESSASEWTGTVTEFASLFASGCTGFWIWLDFELVYPINGVAMTVGTRKENSTIGAGSVSIGSGNTASGNGSAAFGKDLIVTHDYGVIVGENNVPIENANTGVEEDVAFAVGAGGSTPFAILKNGIMIMSAVNSGMSELTNFKYGKTTDVRVDFEHEYPNTPFIFMTLNEDNIPSNRIADYSRIQIYLKSVDTTGFTATVVHGGTADHTFNFSWLAICPM